MNVAFSQPVKLHITVSRVWLSGQFLRRAGPAVAAAPLNCGPPLDVDDSTDVPQVRRHKHEEDVAYRGDSCSYAEQCWLLLLQLASPSGSARGGMPAATASMQSLHHRAGHVRRACSTGRALCAAAAMVMVWRFEAVAEVAGLQAVVEAAGRQREII